MEIDERLLRGCVKGGDERPSFIAGVIAVDAIQKFVPNRLCSLQ